MAEADLPSRFVTQTEIETSNARRDEAWKAAYARIGQEPPQRDTVDEKYDGRSLAEKLAANRAAKQEEFENSHKLSAQFRSLDPDEINFLDEVAVRRMEEERKVKEGDEEMLKGFRAAVQARDTTLGPPIPGVSTSPTLTKSHALPSDGIPGSSTSPPISPIAGTSSSAKSQTKTPTLPPPKTKSIKAGLKGVVVQRKRSKAGVPATAATSVSVVGGGGDGKSVGDGKAAEGKDKEVDKGKEDGGDRKRRRVE